MKKIQVHRFGLGSMGTNCYLIMNTQTGAAVLVDPADMAPAIFKKVKDLNAKPEAILLTHGHFDHIGAVDAVRCEYDIPVLAMKDEKKILENPSMNLSSMFGKAMKVEADRFLSDGEILSLAGMEIKVIHTPGHTIGGACYYIAEENILISGDTLFHCSVGRTDFPTGSMRQLHDSIHEKLFVLPDETEVYPGHDATTSIGFEKKFNPY